MRRTYAIGDHLLPIGITFNLGMKHLELDLLVLVASLIPVGLAEIIFTLLSCVTDEHRRVVLIPKTDINQALTGKVKLWRNCHSHCATQ